MELNLHKQSITINEAVHDGTLEQPIECDALLPDYCPDIIGVLKCVVSTHIGNTSVGGNRLTIEGTALAHVYYSAEGGEVRHTEYKIPFAKSLELKGTPNFPVVAVRPSVDYVNCRAVNQRRVDIRGALSLAVKVTDSKEQQIISDAQGGGLQLRREMAGGTDLIGQYETTFGIEENLDLGYGKPSINTIVRTDCRVNVQDYKVIGGKVVAKGDLLLHICYQSMDGGSNLEVMEYTLPISQIIDAQGADDECICDVEMFVASCDVQPAQDGDGEYRIFELEAKIKAAVTVYRHKEISVISDCYSISHDSSCKRRPISFTKLLSVVRESVMHKATLDLPEGIDCVLDSWCEVEDLSWKAEMGVISLSLKVNVSMFARMEDGSCKYFEQQSECEHKISIPGRCEDISFEPTADVYSSAYNLLGKEKIDIRCEICIKGCIFCEVKCDSLDEIMVNEDSPKVKEKNKLYIYYAQPGESIWDIAKHYNTSAAAIWDENNATSDILEGMAMLLIPILE